MGRGIGGRGSKGSKKNHAEILRSAGDKEIKNQGQVKKGAVQIEGIKKEGNRIWRRRDRGNVPKSYKEGQDPHALDHRVGGKREMRDEGVDDGRKKIPFLWLDERRPEHREELGRSKKGRRRE